MDHFHSRDGRLFCEEVDLVHLARLVGTPAYIYSKAALSDRYREIESAFAALHPLICFSVKSCPNLGVLRTLVGLGAGLDVVSGGELHRARLAGCSPARTVFAGVGKSTDEITDALGEPDESLVGAPVAPCSPIGLLNVESEQEFQAIARTAESLDRLVALALRVNPDVDPHTHRYTTTGTAENKFGVDLRRAREFFRHYHAHPFARLTGIHLHLGSPVPAVEPYVEAIARILSLIDDLARDGIPIDTLDLGGGFDTAPGLSAAAYAAAIVPLLQGRVAAGSGGGLRIILEPGRSIAAGAGVLLTRVQYIKAATHKKFVICDAGMHTLIRPALYQAEHFIWPADTAPAHELPAARRTDARILPGLEPADVVGPICESSDFLCQSRPLPPVAPGDVLAVFDAGAYGMSMASRYNSHPLPVEVLIDGDHADITRRRETYADLVHHELDVQKVSL